MILEFLTNFVHPCAKRSALLLDRFVKFPDLAVASNRRLHQRKPFSLLYIQKENFPAIFFFAPLTACRALRSLQLFAGCNHNDLIEKQTMENSKAPKIKFWNL